MAKFRCKSSGTIIEFTTPYDIDSMKGHPDYERLDEEGHAVVEQEEHKPLPFNSPQRGRPKKAK
jgi:hypothetical protein